MVLEKREVSIMLGESYPLSCLIAGAIGEGLGEPWFCVDFDVDAKVFRDGSDGSLVSAHDQSGNYVLGWRVQVARCIGQ